VVSVTTYRDAGFVPEAFINFLCLLGWSPKNDREVMSMAELTEAFTLEGINRANAVVNFSEADPFDPKAVWLNAEHIRGLAVEDLSKKLLAVVRDAGVEITPEKMLDITPLVRERMKLLRDVLSVADFFFVKELPQYESAELIPQKGDIALAATVLDKAREVLAKTEFSRQKLEEALRGAAQEVGMKAGPFFGPIRVAVTGKKNAPPLFETLEVLGRETTLARIEQAIQKIQVVPERSS
jgi:glutamyl-tRNA synthetase